jgi:hypothetical protein
VNDVRARASSPLNVRLAGCLALVLHALLFGSAASHLHALALLGLIALAWVALDALLLGAWVLAVQRSRLVPAG